MFPRRDTDCKFPSSPEGAEGCPARGGGERGKRRGEKEMKRQWVWRGGDWREGVGDCEFEKKKEKKKGTSIV